MNNMNIYETKKYKEAWAALAMIKMDIIHKPFSTDWLKDGPDLQIDSIGIEVTEAIEPLEGEQRHFQNELIKCLTFQGAQNLNNSYQFRNSKTSAKRLGDTDLPFIYRTSLEEKNSHTTDDTDLIVGKIISFLNILIVNISLKKDYSFKKQIIFFLKHQRQ